MGKKLTHDLHHRKPKSQGGGKEPRNLSTVPVKKHRAWHLLFRNCKPEEIARIINATWLDPDFKLTVERR